MLASEMPSFERSSDGYILIQTDVSQSHILKFHRPLLYFVIHELMSLTVNGRLYKVLRNFEESNDRMSHDL